MTDYEPLDLSAACNAGLELLGQEQRAAIGMQRFQGLPFQVGAAEPDQRRCFVAFGTGLREQAFSLPIGRTARRVIVAHRLLDFDPDEGNQPGRPLAEYAFRLADGRRLATLVRERFEITSIPPEYVGGFHGLPDLPYRAFSDDRQTLYPRTVGPWGEAGRRQKEVAWTIPRSYVLWVWTNPDPEQAIEALEIRPLGPRCILAALTLCHLEEFPFVRAGRRPIRIALLRPEDASRPFKLEVEVDRGLATYAYSLSPAPPERYLADDLKGWGEAPNPASSPAYAEVAAIPSATLSVRHGEELLGSVRWGEVEQRGTAETPRLRVELVDRGRNWVRTRVLDDGSGRPIPCRVHFRSPEGVPFQPHGHPAHVNSNLGTWHQDIGGDVRLGQASYAYIDGTCEGWLPRGEVLVDVARGFEYQPLRARVSIEPGQQELVLRLKRWRDMNAERWFSGDTHVHFLSTQGSHLEAAGEDLNVVNLLQAQWGHLFTSLEEFTGRPSVSPDGRTVVYVSQENRQHFMGHLSLLGLKRHVMPWGSDGPNEAELGGTLETTLSAWADACHAQGGTVIIPHHPMPNGEQAALIATGRADGVEMLWQAPFNHKDYYRYLNGGYRLPLVGGTDKMTAEVPVGLYRTYVYVPPEEEFSHKSWCRNLARGRAFLSGGPLLDFMVEGHRLGDTVSLPGNGGTLEVQAAAESIFPIHSLQIVQQGRVVTSTEEPGGTRRLHLRTSIKVDGHTWLAARVGGPGYFQALRHRDVARRGVFAHTSPIYVACGGAWSLASQDTARYMLTLIEGGLTYIRETAAHDPTEAVTHHHGQANHLAFLERPFLEARAAIERKLREA
jgi:hypothetical protein